MPYQEMCPLCGRWLRQPNYADDVLECPSCGPVVFLGKQGRDVVISDISAPEESEETTGAMEEAIRALARLIAPHLGKKQL